MSIKVPQGNVKRGLSISLCEILRICGGRPPFLR